MTASAPRYPLSPVQRALLLRVHRGELVSLRGVSGKFITDGFGSVAERNAWPGLLSRLGLLRVDDSAPARDPRRWYLTAYGRRELIAAGLIDSRTGQVPPSPCLVRGATGRVPS